VDGYAPATVVYLVLYMMCIGMYGAGVACCTRPSSSIGSSCPTQRPRVAISAGTDGPGVAQTFGCRAWRWHPGGLLGVSGLPGMRGLARTGLSMSTLGAGMIVGARVVYQLSSAAWYSKH